MAVEVVYKRTTFSIFTKVSLHDFKNSKLLKKKETKTT